MPSRYTFRTEADDIHVHVYNRGVEKRVIFMDTSDYEIFVYYLFVYLAKPENIEELYPKLPLRLKNHNMSKDISLVAYCLMPNHFHLLLHQHTQGAISKFMQQLTNAYTEYFNKKYNRVGSLFQGKYKSIGVFKDEYLLHLTRYIHRNPLVLANLSVWNLHSYPWSSYNDYLGNSSPTFIKPSTILQFFSSTYKGLSYQAFVEVEIADKTCLPAEYMIQFD